MSRSLVLMLAVVLLALSACGGGHGAPSPSPGGAPTAAPANPLAAGLPALSELPVPTRQVSLSGPGWYNIPVAEMDGSSGAVLNADAIDLTGIAPLAFALYGVCLFDGDNGPTSVKATVAGLTGEYYIGFSDYSRGSWAFCGPFNASAEASVPEMDHHTSVHDFVSPLGASYVVIAIEPAAALTLTKLELGVHGGVKGPRPPTKLYSLNDTPSVRLDWTNSLDSTAPDFAGYYIESAPLLAGDFTPQNATPAKVDYWLDSASITGQSYRYRVCAVDASGNRSAWIECNGFAAGGSQIGAVAKMRGPHGMLYGPAQVSFDFSDSYTLDDSVITEYDLSFVGGPSSSAGSPVVSATLQPGCYLVAGTIQASGTAVSFDETFSKLIVYPRWQDQPVVVRAAMPPGGLAQSRLQNLRGCALPSGEAVLVGYDATAASLAVWQGPTAGMPKLTLLPVENVLCIGEAVEVASNSGYAYFPVLAADKLYLMVVGPGRPYLAGGWPNTGVFPSPASYTAAAAVGDGAWIFTNRTTSTDGLTWYNLNASGSDTGQIAFLEPATAFDAVAVPMSNAIDIVYSTATVTAYVRLDLATESVTQSTQLASVAAGAIDLELDPATGRPVLAYSYGSQHYYRELDAVGSWMQEMAIDPAVTCFAPLDIAYDDGVLYAYFATWPSGVTARYKYDAGVWTRLTDASFSGDDGYQVALLPLTGEPASLVADVDNAGTVFLAKMTVDLADEVLWQIPAGDGQGFELHASAGPDGLHAVWRSELSDRLRHYLSADSGATWQDADPGLALPIGARGIDLSRDKLALDLWLSYEDGINSSLLRWDASAPGFNLSVSSPNNGHQRPYLAHCYQAAGMLWEAFDGASSMLNYVGGMGDELVPIPWSQGGVVDGVIAGESTDVYHSFPALISYYDSVESGVYTLGLLSYMQPAATAITPVTHIEWMYSPVVLGRTLAETRYNNGVYGTNPGPGYTVTFFASYGYGDLPLRYDLSDTHTPLTTDVLFPTPTAGEARRTVSAAMAQGDTGVVLIASLDGSQALFQWSNFGQWQDIPLPKGLTRAFQPELVVGTDGRWHILYKDWLTDDLMCWSTL